MFRSTIQFIKNLYPSKKEIFLLESVFQGNELTFIKDCLTGKVVSTLGKTTSLFEKKIEELTGARYATAIMNGTSALFIALKQMGATFDTEVITQSFTFISTVFSISHTGACPVFIDVEKETLGLDPTALNKWLKTNTKTKNRITINKKTGKKISACIPVHSLGHPCRIDEIVKVCSHYDIPVIEDAAQALGSYFKNQHCGTFGKMGILSFNGNKIITTGGGGAILCNNKLLAEKIRCVTDNAKHRRRDGQLSASTDYNEIGYNFRMPAINAALGLGQMENFDFFISQKRTLANLYKFFFDSISIQFIQSPPHSQSNYWLNAILLKNQKERNIFINELNKKGIRVNTIWKPAHVFKLYRNFENDGLPITEEIYKRLVILPSSVKFNPSLLAETQSDSLVPPEDSIIVSVR